MSVKSLMSLYPIISSLEIWTIHTHPAKKKESSKKKSHSSKFLQIEKEKRTTYQHRFHFASKIQDHIGLWIDFHTFQFVDWKQNLQGMEFDEMAFHNGKILGYFCIGMFHNYEYFEHIHQCLAKKKKETIKIFFTWNIVIH